MFVERYVVPGAELAAVGRAMLPSTFTVHLLQDDGGAPDVVLAFEVRQGRVECRDVRITAQPGGGQVTLTGLAGVRVEDWKEWAIRDLMLEAGAVGERGPTGLARWYDTEVGLAAGGEAVRESRRAGRVRITDDLLREVAEVYRLHASYHPTEMVADHLGKSHRTATLYVKKAREAGFLGPAIKGKAGEA